jgi:hypothetical protein
MNFTASFEMFASNYQASEEGKLNYQDYLLRCPEEEQLETDPSLQCGLWALQTDTVRYPENQNICPTREYLSYTTQTNKRNKLQKQTHFNPDNNNIPNFEHLRLINEKAQVPKITNFDAYNCNIPQAILEEDRYMGVALHGTDKFDPAYDISATYLWSEKFSLDTKSPDSWFHTGIIPLNQYNMTSVFLADQSRLITLFDSGATKTLIGKAVVDSHPILKHCPRFKLINQRPFKMADNKVLVPIEAIQMVVKIGYHWFELFAFVIDLMDDIDLIIGQKSMLELEGCLNIRKLQFEFKQRSIPVFPNKTHRIAPGHTTYMNCTLDRVPPGLSDCEVIIKLESKRADGVPQTEKVTIKGDEVRIGITNPMIVEISPTIVIKHNQPVGIIDFRSAGYFHLSRQSLQNTLKDHFMFVDDSPKRRIPGNSRLAHDESKHITKEMTEGFLVDKNDPYPWLEPDDPRRNMTDREIIESTIDLSESNLTSREKRRFLKTIRNHRNVFSLRDEIGSCPNMEVHLELTDYTPFGIRPKRMKRYSLTKICEKDVS